MEIQQLTTFLTASHTLSFTKTAEQLGYSQAAVTIQIKQLETDLGLTLFDRIGKKITLTSEGITLQHYASQILSSIQEAKMVLTENHPSGSLRLGASDSLCTYILPSITAQFHALYPSVSLSIQTGSAPELLNQLNQNQVDLVCLFTEQTPPQDFQILFKKSEPFVFLSGNEYPIAHINSLSLADLEHEAFLLTEPGCSYRKLLEEVFLSSHLSLTPILEIGNTEAIKRFCMQNLGIAFLPYFTVKDECQKGSLQIIHVNASSFCLNHTLLCHKQKYLSPAIKTFVSCYAESQTQ